MLFSVKGMRPRHVICVCLMVSVCTPNYRSYSTVAGAMAGARACCIRAAFVLLLHTSKLIGMTGQPFACTYRIQSQIAKKIIGKKI